LSRKGESHGEETFQRTWGTRYQWNSEKREGPPLCREMKGGASIKTIVKGGGKGSGKSIRTKGTEEKNHPPYKKGRGGGKRGTLRSALVWEKRKGQKGNLHRGVKVS